MRAKKGEWFSLSWDMTYHDEITFQQLDCCPKFIYAEKDSKMIESAVINKFYRLRLTRIFLTQVFIEDENGVRLPTHYMPDKFMPGDSPTYDKWLAEYHRVQYKASEKIRDREALQQKKVFLEHTAKVIRHDMHSGINTYLPRGVKSLLKKLPDSVIKEYKLESSLKLLDEGVKYTQKVYKGVYAFTNLVKEDPILELSIVDLKEELLSFIEGNAYEDCVLIDTLVEWRVHPILFCTAIDNLIKGGLRFNNSEKKQVEIYMESPTILCVKDNGVGLSKRDFLLYCKPYLQKETAAEDPKGLELNIAVAILEDHGFRVYPEKQEIGTVFKIELAPDGYLIERC